MNINSTQIQTTIGPILGLVAGYFAAWWGIDQAQALGILTALCALGYTVYNAFITRKSALVTQVAGMDEVKKDGGIILDKTVAGSAALEAATPNNVISK